jgi:protein TonB
MIWYVPETTGDVAVVGESRPRRVWGEGPQCTPEAKERSLSGTVFAKCVITTEGTLDQCRLLRDTPPFGAEVMRVLPAWRMTPVAFKGERRKVDYGFPFRFKCWPAGP